MMGLGLPHLDRPSLCEEKTFLFLAVASLFHSSLLALLRPVLPKHVYADAHKESDSVCVTSRGWINGEGTCR